MMRRRPIRSAFIVAALVQGGSLAAATPERTFLRANATVMDRMMASMAARPSGDIDADFVNMMEPHHQGAIEMAELELRYGTNEKLRRIAQEIIVDQQQEIAAMRLALGRPLPPSGPTPTQGEIPTQAAALPVMDMDRHDHSVPKER